MDSQFVEAEKAHFQEKFDINSYLSVCYKTPGTPENKLRDKIIATLHEAFKQRSAKLAGLDRVRVLDYGCGPVVCNVISAAGLPQVTEIVMADYVDSCRDAVQQWLSKHSSAFDWSPYFRHVVGILEGKTDVEVTEREERVRSLVKLVHCDITADPLIERGFEEPYDLVIAFLVFENVCPSIEEYQTRMVRFSSLIKPGGVLMSIAAVRALDGGLAAYSIGTEQFHYVCVSLDIVTDALKNASFTISSVEAVGTVQDLEHGRKDFVFICAEKNV